MRLRPWTLVVLIGCFLVVTFITFLQWQHRPRLIAQELPIENFQIEMNHADIQEWRSLPGIGTTLAKRILQLRESKGGFRSVNELLEVRGIGPKKMSRIKKYIAPVISTHLE